jgi:hypothetical protein
MSSHARQALYLVLALAGLTLTWYHNILFSLEQGGNLMAFIEQAMANHASSSLTLDVSIAALTFIVWMWFEAERLGMRHRWLWVLLTMGVAVAFAFPLFLMIRERRLQEAGGQIGS